MRAADLVVFHEGSSLSRIVLDSVRPISHLSQLLLGLQPTFFSIRLPARAVNYKSSLSSNLWPSDTRFSLVAVAMRLPTHLLCTPPGVRLPRLLRGLLHGARLHGNSKHVYGMQRSLVASGQKNLNPREPVRLDEVLQADTT